MAYAVILAVALAIVLYYGIQIAKKKLYIYQLMINERELDLIEKVCTDAINATEKEAQVHAKVCDIVGPEDKKKQAVVIAKKMAWAHGIPEAKWELVDDMIEAILGSWIEDGASEDEESDGDYSS
jgi:hypothetical protein